MTHYEILATGLTVIGVILIPLIAIMVRMIVKWTRIEDKLSHVADSIDKLVKDKDQVHGELLAQMREDRKATDRRLRWLEENRWKA